MFEPVSARVVVCVVAWCEVVEHDRSSYGEPAVGGIERRAGGRGVREVVVLTDTPWMSALAFYRSCGFEDVGQDDTDTHFALPL